MILNFSVGDLLELKKVHPCGGRTFRVLYAASDVRIRCESCGKEMILPRVKIEKSIKRIVSGE